MIVRLVKFKNYCSLNCLGFAKWKCFTRHISRFFVKNSIEHKIDFDKLENSLYTSAGQLDFTRFAFSRYSLPNFPIKNVYVNQLPANYPIEDRWNIGLTQIDQFTNSCLFTVLDGHSGTSCVQTLAWTLLDYVAASLYSRDKLDLVFEQLVMHDCNQPYHLLSRLDIHSLKTSRHQLDHQVTRAPSNILATYMRECLRDYIKQLLDQPNRNIDPLGCFTNAILRIDDDICSTFYKHELFDNASSTSSCHIDEHGNHLALSRHLIRVGLSGAVGIVGQLSWSDDSNAVDAPIRLHLANVGDCGAVILRQDPNNGGQLVPIQCTLPHAGAVNAAEIKRVSNEHLDNAKDEIFRNGGRLLGELAPSRAFGNVRYKWPAERLCKLSTLLEETHVPRPYTSPPYLTANPEITSFEITPNDRYLVLATDGLWDMLDATQVASQLTQLQIQSPHSCPATQLIWSSLNQVLPPAQSILNEPNNEIFILDRLLKHRSFLYSCEQRKIISQVLKLLTLPPRLARYMRDDITILVVEFAKF